LRGDARLIVRMGLPSAAKNPAKNPAENSAKNPAKPNERAGRLEQLRPASNL